MFEKCNFSNMCKMSANRANGILMIVTMMGFHLNL